MGGFSTLAFTAMHPDLFSGICAQNAIVNLFEYDLWGEMIRISYGGTPREKPDEYKRRSAEYWPERFTMPVTLTTGGQDGMCPYYHVHAFANVLQRLGKKPLLIHRPLGRHSTTYADFAAEFDYMMMTINLRDGFALPQGQRNLLRGGGLFCEGLTPDVPANSGQREIGLKVLVTEDGRLTGVHFFKAPGEEATNHVLRLWNDAGQKALEIVSDNESVFGWQRIPLKAPYSVKKGQTYVISYTASAQYPDSPGFFEGPENPGSNKVIVKPVEKPGLTAQNGVYCFEIGQKAPDRTSYNMNYFVDADYVKE